MRWTDLTGDDLLLLGAILKLGIADMEGLAHAVAESPPGELAETLVALRVLDSTQLAVLRDEDFSAIRSRARFDDSRASGVVRMLPPTPRLGDPAYPQDTQLDAEDPANRKTAEIDTRAIRPVADPEIEDRRNLLRAASTQVDLEVRRPATPPPLEHDAT